MKNAKINNKKIKNQTQKVRRRFATVIFFAYFVFHS